jgi:hypothetical protein
MYTDRCGNTSGRNVIHKEVEKELNTRVYVKRYNEFGI